MWLAKILKPLLNHRVYEDQCCGTLSLGDTNITLDDGRHVASWKSFEETGLLDPELAKVLWPDGLSDYVIPTLKSLGMAHSLDGDPTQRLVVLLRLREERPPDVGKNLDDFRRDHIEVLNITWKFFMGAPPGAVEKVLMRCCGIGTPQKFWRFGVLIQDCMGEGVAAKTFALLVEYSHERKTIDMKVYGNISTVAPWAALSLGISAVRNMCLEFPGLGWRAFLTCPQHGRDMPVSKEVSLLLFPCRRWVWLTNARKEYQQFLMVDRILGCVLRASSL